MTEHDRFMASEEAGRVASERQVSGRRVSTQKRPPHTTMVFSRNKCPPRKD